MSISESPNQSVSPLEISGQSDQPESSIPIPPPRLDEAANDLVESILAIHQGGRGRIELSCFEQDAKKVHFLRHEHLTQQDLCEELKQEFDRKDLFVSICRYFGQDQLSQVAGVSVVCAELKPAEHGTEMFPWQRGTTPEECAREVLAYLPPAGLGDTKPWIVWTGSGLLLIWRLDHLPGSAEPRWRALQKDIAQRLKPMGADPNQIDMRMSVRAAGSWNSAGNIPENHRRTRILVRGGMHEFDVLCDRLLPIARDELQRQRKQGNKHRTSAASLWRDRLAGIQTWAKTVWPHGVPDAFRDNVVWLAAVAIGWSTRDPDDVGPAIHSFICAISPFALAENIDEWAGLAHDRLANHFNGQQEHYRFTDEALADAITRGLGQAERDAWQEIVADSLSKRQKRRGSKSGRVRQLDRLPNLQKAKELFTEGKSYCEIGELLGVSKSTAWRWVNE